MRRYGRLYEFDENIDAKLINQVKLNRSLRKAVIDGNVNEVKDLIEAGANVNIKNEFGTTILMEATTYDYREIVKMLLRAGADVNVKDVFGNTALIYAAYIGHTEIVKMLLEGGADVNAKDRDGNTALMKAAEEKNTEIVKMLLEDGAEVDPDDTETMKFIVDHNLDYLVK